MNKIYFLLSIFICVAFVGCDNWADDFNENKNIPNPNAASTTPSSFMGAMFTGPIGDGRMEWVAFNSIHPVIGYWGRTESLSQGARHRAWHDFDGNVWPYCYTAMTNIKNVRNAAKTFEQPQYAAIADIWESWLMYTLTNFYGDIPYFAIVKDTLVFTSDYDKQADIYLAILDKLKNANDLIAANPANVDANSDYIYEGNVENWRKFANMLRIRMCMYMYNANPERAGNILNELLGDPQKYPVFASNSDNCYIRYDGTTKSRSSIITNENPAKWERELLMSNVMIQRLVTLNDPRLPVYAYPVKKVHTGAGYIKPTNPGKDKYLGHMYGLTTSNSDATVYNGGNEYASTLGPWFRPLDNQGQLTNEAKKTPCFLATYPEMLFLLAEAAHRGIISGNAKEYYENGIKAAFDQYGATFDNDGYRGAFVDEDGINKGVATEAEYLQQQQAGWDGGRDKLTLIAEQKWIASFFLMLEPYFDHRRTMLPKLSCSDKAKESTDGSGQHFPSRADYPSSEEMTNNDGWAKARATGFNIPITGDNNRTLAKMWLIASNSPSLLMPEFKEPINKEGEYPGGANFQKWWDANWKSLYWWEYE